MYSSTPSINEKTSENSSKSSFFESWARWASTHPLKPVPSLTWKLFKNLIHTGPFWIFLLFRFLSYVWILMPGWLRLAWYYLTSRDVRLNIKYGDNPRNYLDIFLPESVLSGKKCPVVIFITGGVWMIGYKAWGTLLGRLLSRCHIITVSVDYRNYPQGNMTDIITDVDNSIEWTFRNIWKYGGDPNHVYLVGQSAGAHLGAFNYLRKITEEVSQKLPSDHFSSQTNWRARNLRAFVGVSGPYDLPNLREPFHKKGLHRDLLHNIFGGEEGLEKYSPVSLLEKFQESSEELQKYRFFITHGKDDNSISHKSSEEFHKLVLGKGFISDVKVYPKKSHTDLIIEDLMMETLEEATFYQDLLQFICKHSNHQLEIHDRSPYEEHDHSIPKEKINFLDNSPRVVSPKLVSLAKYVCPF